MKIKKNKSEYDEQINYFVEYYSLERIKNIEQLVEKFKEYEFKMTETGLLDRLIIPCPNYPECLAVGLKHIINEIAHRLDIVERITENEIYEFFYNDV